MDWSLRDHLGVEVTGRRPPESDEIAAALDIGSNTIRLLVAKVVDGAIDAIADESRFVGLGRGVETTGHLDPERKAAGLEAIAELARGAERLSAGPMAAVATSAIREALDGPEYLQRIEEETGVRARLIDGTEEARLTFLGASHGVDLSAAVLVVDLGGGSCELILSREGAIEWVRSLPIGSGRLAERFSGHDPPTGSERTACARFVESVLTARAPRIATSRTVFTGGTASHLQHLLGLAVPLSPVTYSDVGTVEDMAYSPGWAEIAAGFDIRPERARILPAGITALRAIARWSGPGQLLISRGGIREGLLLEEARGR